ncbi:MAG: glycoside hydrolase family 130 protein [Candidatus Eremiobacteraeota bacterium]|nr:glycoside hydrolase family 130 protein [Candidatus Eremiobacteraeota bacterium]MCW5867799.1 glycoside hydrolase family 130 protein [Candidatus Eremiobacteraeota bacterium]
MSLEIERLPVSLGADPRRVLLKRYHTGEAQAQHIIDRVLSYPEEKLAGLLQETLALFGDRHAGLHQRMLARAQEVKQDESLSPARRALLGACFLHEYSVEAAALFNPSIVPHPDQSGLSAGSLRFIMSLRAVGEGHISSIEFLSGVLDAGANVKLEQRTGKLRLGEVRNQNGSNFEVAFDPGVPLDERILFPYTPSQSNGIEDARFVKCEGRYYGTYTAYDGRHILPQLIETDDFLSFRFVTPGGNAVRNKGMALFPRKVGGRYWMLGRQDGEKLYLMDSSDVHQWNDPRLLLEPVYPWEWLQLGNCGSPLETEAGWLVLTHGVGPMRHYTISACLLDKDQPAKVLGRLPVPLIAPSAEEREGYVPNVVYTCGAIIHGKFLVIPYALSDSAIRFARIPTQTVLAAMV